MTLEEFKNTDWYKETPPVIKQAIDLIPPIKLYRFKDSKKQCFIVGYEEPESDKAEDVTLVVQKTGKGGALSEMGLGGLDTNQVFDVKQTDLEEWTE